MIRAVLFDVNGTLTDPAAIGAVWQRPELGPAILDGAVRTAMVDALLETAARPFSDHIGAAIAVTVAQERLDAGRIDQAAGAARALPARPGAAAALTHLADAGLRLVALTNSGAQAGTETLRHAGLLDHFDGVLGVDGPATFKPHPRVYAYALSELDCRAAEVVMAATHDWDLAGAAHAGISTAWVRHGAPRWPAVLAPPDVEGETLPDLAAAITARWAG